MFSPKCLSTNLRFEKNDGLRGPGSEYLEPPKICDFVFLTKFWKIWKFVKLTKFEILNPRSTENLKSLTLETKMSISLKQMLSCNYFFFKFLKPRGESLAHGAIRILHQHRCMPQKNKILEFCKFWVQNCFFLNIKIIKMISIIKKSLLVEIAFRGHRRKNQTFGRGTRHLEISVKQSSILVIKCNFSD